MDIVAYSMLAIDQQQKILRELQDVVRNSASVKSAQDTDTLIALPTGDGMALVFFGSPESPVKCALEIGRALRQHPEVKLRMGIHTGSVYRVADINAARNVAGGAINMAQRVMDCGDAGHILVSKTVAEVLREVSTWSNVILRDLGEVEVKHGVRVHIYNLHTTDSGNAALPQKVRVARRRMALRRLRTRRVQRGIVITVLIIVTAIAALGLHHAVQLSRNWWLDRRKIAIGRGLKAKYDALEWEYMTGASSRLSLASFAEMENKVTEILELDPTNGHGLYWRGEIARFKEKLQHPRPCVMTEEAAMYFQRYLEALPKAGMEGSDKAEVCYQRPSGFCLQRTAFVHYLLANYSYQQAAIENNPQAKLRWLRQALDEARNSALYRGNPASPGFSPRPCPSTEALITDAEKQILDPRIAERKP